MSTFRLTLKIPFADIFALEKALSPALMCGKGDGGRGGHIRYIRIYGEDIQQPELNRISLLGGWLVGCRSQFSKPGLYHMYSLNTCICLSLLAQSYWPLTRLMFLGKARTSCHPKVNKDKCVPVPWEAG